MRVLLLSSCLFVGGLANAANDLPGGGIDPQAAPMKKQMAELGIKAQFKLAAQAVLQAALGVVARQVRVHRLCLPVRQLAVLLASLKPAALPQSVVAVLDRQGFEGRNIKACCDALEVFAFG